MGSARPARAAHAGRDKPCGKIYAKTVLPGAAVSLRGRQMRSGADKRGGAARGNGVPKKSPPKIVSKPRACTQL
jgi:hypothetical protein